MFSHDCNTPIYLLGVDIKGNNVSHLSVVIVLCRPINNLMLDVSICHNFLWSDQVPSITFLWNSNPEALKRESLLNTNADGGLNIVDIKTKIVSLFIKQVLQLIKRHRAKLTLLAVYWLVIHLRVCSPFCLYQFCMQNKYLNTPITP